MFKRKKHSDRESVVDDVRRTRAGRLTLLATLGFALAGCGGGGGGNGAGQAPDPSTPPAPTYGSLVVTTVTEAGTPLSGVSILLSSGEHAESGPDGVARMDKVRTGSKQVSASLAGYYVATSQATIASFNTTDVTLTLTDVATGATVLLGSQAVPSPDGLTLSVDLDVSVLDSGGEVREDLTAVDFGLTSSCDWDYCLYDAAGQPIWFDFGADVSSAALLPAEPSASGPLATSLLLDHGAVSPQDYDQGGLRFKALDGFLQSIASPDVVGIASYQGVEGVPALTVLSGFTSDGASLQPAVDALAGSAAGLSPVYAALEDLVGYVADETVAAPAGTSRNIVVVSAHWSSGDCTFPPCGDWFANYWTDTVSQARARGVVINGIGPNVDPSSVTTATGGFTAFVADPSQYPILGGLLPRLLHRDLPFHRLHIDLHASSGVDGTFVAGETVFAWLAVQIGPDTRRLWYIAIPVGE
jgi:hypothetical protein